MHDRERIKTYLGPLPPLTRRRFLRGLAAGSAGFAIGSALPAARTARAAAGGRGTSRIVRVSHPEATSGWTTVNQEPVDQMVHRAIRTLTGIPDTAAAWKSIFPGIDATKRVGIKINLACGDVPTHPEVVNAIVDGLLMMDLDGEQLPSEQIIVWDADNPFFCAQTGYSVNYGGPGVQYYGTNHPSVGYDTGVICYVDHGGNQTSHHPSRILSQHFDYMINAAVMKDHDNWAKVTFCLKNNYGSFDGIYDVAMHYAGLSTGIPGLNMAMRDELGNKTKLFLIDATFCLYDGGPGYTPPGHTPPNWAYNSVLVGFDPVAIDRIGTEKLNLERANHGLPSLDPAYVAAAAGSPYDLGTDDLEQIELLEIELGAAGVAADERGPRAIALLAPYPNPSPGWTTLRFHLAQPAAVELLVCDVTGAVVRRIASGPRAGGMHRVRWDGRDDRGRRVANGTYFCRLGSAGQVRGERRIVLAW